MNHIKNIEIKNFKSIRHQTIDDCRRINVFIGYPNTGKSNILEAIGLFSMLQLKNENFNFNEICRVKHFAELFFNQDYRDTNSIIINDEIATELRIGSAKNLEIRINLLVDRAGNPDADNILNGAVYSDNFSIQLSKELNESNYKHIVATIKKYDFQKDAFIKAQKPNSLAIPSGKNLLNVLQSNSNLRKDIVEILRNYKLKLVIDRIDESIKFQKELNDETAVSIPYHQVADTLRRLIFFKAAIQTNSNSIILFEEPEAHMFPPYISKFTSEVTYDENDNQFFIATHSPFVINDFMQNLENEELAIFTVGYDKETGETLIRKMSDDELHEIYQYGVDIFLNLENFLPHAQQQ